MSRHLALDIIVDEPQWNAVPGVKPALRRAIDAAAPAHDKGESLGNTRVKCGPVFAIGRREAGAERIFRQLGIGQTAQVAKVALLQ